MCVFYAQLTNFPHFTTRVLSVKAFNLKGSERQEIFKFYTFLKMSCLLPDIFVTDFIVVLRTIFAIKNLPKTSSPQTKLAAHDVFAFSFDLWYIW